ncbi:hypothetical protein GCM10007891_08850 [Methylophaga thalassica]|uniref:Secreted protein n=1 Tax=Methylophaga thalassica TaxID=40223 RepID=A0ABQ5TS94_9GAMM|nr:hypothetical protein [Methylophaga thalassica]GLP99031.1 hypothetical protein GCM10007891_08850 [Methylophaga thalassica]
MKHSTLKLTMLAALGFTATQANALGLVALPDTGFASSAYTNCYNDGRVEPPTTADEAKGNFGSYPIAGANQPSSSKNNTCFVTKPVDITVSPVSGYTLVAYRSNTIPKTTGGTGSIGTLLDLVWRDDATSSMCIFGTQIASMTNADHDSTKSGTQYFEVNDIARGGFADSGTVNVGYTIFSTTGNTSPVYRVGRTYTSVQHRSLKYDTLANKAVNGTNYLDLPTKNSVTAAITGENSSIDATDTASTTLATQDAVVNSNWVDFTADTVYFDDDGSTNAYSGFTYIEAACDSTNPEDWVENGAIRLRQTAQEETTFKEIAIPGYAPPGATIP